MLTEECHNWFESVPLQVVDILGSENLHPLDSQTPRHNQKSNECSLATPAIPFWYESESAFELKLRL